MARTFGVDEAGKGPVLGSMFAAAVVADPADLPSTVGDSKRLSPDRREALCAELRAHPDVECGVAEVDVGRIDAPGSDMNTLTVEAHVGALSVVSVEGLAGVADAADTDAARFARRVRAGVAGDVDLRAEHRADESHRLVGAASVVAKVARDAHVADLADTYGDVGSGYPSDPTTRAFLRDYVETHGDLPACARTSWSTCSDLLAAAAASTLDEF